jgi:hypothetical protein
MRIRASHTKQIQNRIDGNKAPFEIGIQGSSLSGSFTYLKDNQKRRQSEADQRRGFTAIFMRKRIHPFIKQQRSDA